MNDELHSLQVSQPTHRLTIEQCITAWIATKTRRTQSMQTKRAYGTVITHFREALQATGHDLTSDATLVALAAQGWANMSQDGANTDVSEGTYNQRIAILSSFYRYAMTWGPCMTNPIETLERRPRNTPNAAMPFEAPEIAERLQSIDRSTPEGLRDFALLGVALTTGRRVNELAQLRWSHLHFTGKKIIVTWVHCKGGKVMTDELKAKTASALTAYLHAVYGAELGTLSSDAPIWVSFSKNNHRGAISTQAISDICKKRIGTSKVHALRHTFSVSMEEAGAKLSDIGARLGHESLKTTSDYMKRLHSSENSYAAKLEDMFGI